MCIVFSIIEHTYWYPMVILSSMFVGESLYVSFPRSFFICIHFVTYFLWEWDEWPSHRALGHCPFHYYIHCWCDFTSCLIWVDHHFFFCIFIVSLSSSSLLLIHHICFTHFFFLHWPIPSLIFPFASFWHISLSIWFASLSHYWYFIHIGHPQVHDSQTLLYMLHFIHEDMGFWSLSIWA